MIRRNLALVTIAGSLMALVLAACNLGTPITTRGGGGTDVGGISGTLVDAGGTPVAGAQVRVVPVVPEGLGKVSDMAMPRPDSAVTNASGTFEIPGLATGTYNLVALVTNDTLSLGVFVEGIVVTGGNRETNIGARTLELTAEIRIEIREDDGPPLQGALCLLGGTPFQAVSGASGTCDFGVLPPGVFSLTVTHPDLQFTISGQLAALPGLAGAFSLADIIGGSHAVQPAPRPAVPVNGGILTDTVATFFWTPVTGAVRYHLQIATDSMFSTASLRYNDSLFFTHYLYVAGLEAGNTQYWRVRAITLHGRTDWSATWSYTTPNPSQEPPVPDPVSKPVAPVNLTATLADTEGGKATVILGWDLPVPIGKAPGSGTFVLRSPGDGMCHAPGSQTSCAISGLDWGVAYTFSAVSSNPLGLGDTSAAIVFTPIPSPPALVGPQGGAVGSPVTFVWHSVAGAVRYRMQVATDTLFLPQNLLVEDTIPSERIWSTQNLPQATTLAWRVRAEFAGGVTAWSPALSFGTSGHQVAALQAPSLILPVQGAVNISPYPPPMFIWNSVSDATGYHLQVALDTGFTSLVVNDSVLHDTNRTVGEVGYLASYYWRVRALNPAGTSAWSEVRNFSTSDNMPPDSIAPFPAGPPGAPTIMSAVVASAPGAATASVTVTWSPPADTVTGTFVSAAPSGSCYAPSQQTSCTLPGLTWGVEYSMRAIAANAFGTGDTSAVYLFTPVPQE